MDFKLTEEQQALADSVARFAERDYTWDARRKLALTSEGYSASNWATFAELGWFGAGLSEDEGGFGGGPAETALLFEGFGRMLLIEPVLGHAVLALQALAGLPDSPRKAELVEQAMMGDPILALAHNEADGWGLPSWVETRAEQSGEGWTLTGAKSRILGAEAAGQFLVSARISGNTDDEGGLGLFLVDAAEAGIALTPYRLVDNHRVADIVLTGAQGELLAQGAAAFCAIRRATHHGILAACAEMLGAMDAALWQTRDYLLTRKQFGTTLNNFQGLQHRMADMLVETELSRSMLFQALAAMAGPEEERDRALSAAKVSITNSAIFTCRNAIQLHGGIGMTEELMVGHFYKRVWVLSSMLGNTDHHLDNFMAQTVIEQLPADIVALG
jgi:alkylation response protein AidB-like acyl-CoA dehydrogenase